jgi:outer membrane receptor protein involved in Fe transport
MRPSRTSALVLTGLLSATLAGAQEPPPSDETKKPPPPAKAKEATPPAQADDSSKPLAFREEIEVTAQKRKEAIADIPASVTVVGGPPGTAARR